MLPGVFVPQRMADTARVVQQRAGDELRRGSGDLFRQGGCFAVGRVDEQESIPSFLSMVCIWP